MGAGSTPEELKQLFCYDHTFIRFKNSYRSIDNFEEVAVAVLDNDNDHSDDPGKWIYVQDIPRLFPDVPCIVYTSRNHMKQKGNRSPRPRFHVAFPVEPIADPNQFTALMQRIQMAYPFFDDNALDAGRFFFGNPDTEVYIFPGSTAIDRFLDEQAAEDAFAEMERTIPEGSRNSTLSHAAGKILKRWGDTKEAGKRFLEEAEKCSPPLDRAELQQIWNSALKFYRGKVTKQPDYENGDLCSTPHLYEDDLKAHFITALGQLLTDRTALFEDGRLILKELLDTTALDADSNRTLQEMDVVAGMIRQMVNENANQVTDQTAYADRYNSLVERYETLQVKYDDLQQQKERRQVQAEAIRNCLDALEALELPQIAYTDGLWNTALDHVTVFADDRLVFHFKNGSEVEVKVCK